MPLGEYSSLLRKNRKLDKTKKKERKLGNKLNIKWREIYTKSYYFDKKVEPYDTLVGDIQDAYVLVYERYTSSLGMKTYNHGKKYNTIVINILKTLRKLYKKAGTKITNKNLILAWGLAFDTKSKFYKKRHKSPSIEVPTILPTPYEKYVDNSSKDNREEREKQINDYSFGKLGNKKSDIELILLTLAVQLQLIENAKHSFIIRTNVPFMITDVKAEHLFVLFDKHVEKKIEEDKENMSEEEYKNCKRLIKERQYFDFLDRKNIKKIRAELHSKQNKK